MKHANGAHIGITKVTSNKFWNPILQEFSRVIDGGAKTIHGKYCKLLPNLLKLIKILLIVQKSEG